MELKTVLPEGTEGGVARTSWLPGRAGEPREEGRFLRTRSRSEPADARAGNSTAPSESLVQLFDNLPRPGYIAIGMKTWANESAYRNVRFRNMSF